MSAPRRTARPALGAVALALFGLAGCVSMLGLGEEDFGVLENDTCKMVRKVCEGKYDLEIVFGTAKTCEQIVAEATSDGGPTTADEIHACFDYETCVEVLDCLVDYNVLESSGVEACRPSGEPCLERCFPDDCLAPHRCCDTDCTDGLCE